MAWAHPLPIPGSELSSQPLFSCSPQQEMALQSPYPHRQDICAPDPCILLSLGSCPEHLCPSHPWMVITPGPATSSKYSSHPSPITHLVPWHPSSGHRLCGAAPSPGLPWGLQLLPPPSRTGCSEPQGGRGIPQALPEAPLPD